MKYALEHDSELLKAFREEFPMNQAAIDRIKRTDIFNLQEVVLAHYEINSRTNQPLKNEKLKGIDFQRFIEEVDVFSIVHLFRLSFAASEVKLLKVYGILEPVRTKDYVEWAAKKGLPLPECLTAEIQPWELPKFRVIKDVQRIDWDNLPPSVLAALGANSFAQASKRADPKVKVPSIYRLQIMKKFLGDCAVAESMDAVKAEDTIREYIEHQFAD
jgi:hypothetical protein